MMTLRGLDFDHGVGPQETEHQHRGWEQEKELLTQEVEHLRKSKAKMEADVQQAWLTANEAVGQARVEIEKLGEEKDQELALMQQNCRDQILQLGRECERAMTELSERKADEMATLEESCRLKSERVQQEKSEPCHH